MKISFQKLDEALSQIFEKSQKELIRSFERTLLRLDAPNVETKFNLKKFRKTSERMALAVYSWYLPRGPRILLQEELRELKFSERVDLYRLRGLLSSKESCLRVLHSSFSERDFFGNQVGFLKVTSGRLRFCLLLPRQARKKVRRRGYQDKGSCRPQDRWLPEGDLSLTKLQVQSEFRKDFTQMVLRLVDQFGPLGVRLDEIEDGDVVSPSTTKTL